MLHITSTYFKRSPIQSCLFIQNVLRAFVSGYFVACSCVICSKYTVVLHSRCHLRRLQVMITFTDLFWISVNAPYFFWLGTTAVPFLKPKRAPDVALVGAHHVLGDAVKKSHLCLQGFNTFLLFFFLLSDKRWNVLLLQNTKVNVIYLYLWRLKSFEAIVTLMLLNSHWIFCGKCKTSSVALHML